MYCDSKAAIAISCNPVQHFRTKHIDVRYHFIKEQVEKGIVELFFVEIKYQLADLFTKALPEDRFKYLVRRLGMRCLTPEELEVGVPPVDHRDDIPKTNMPPHKRLCLSTLGSRYEVRESSTARPTEGQGIDYGFVSTLDAKVRRKGIGEVGYGIRDTWGFLSAWVLSLVGTGSLLPYVVAGMLRGVVLIDDGLNTGNEWFESMTAACIVYWFVRLDDGTMAMLGSMLLDVTNYGHSRVDYGSKPQRLFKNTAKRNNDL
nr:retrovirus-related Pol polyprotein from transposon TNT 1-94 [Tanacetum cinerariifolium]